MGSIDSDGTKDSIEVSPSWSPLWRLIGAEGKVGKSKRKDEKKETVPASGRISKDTLQTRASGIQRQNVGFT